tara:strand:+ start:332 stop:532 length:201 start_codon:yes stop_codon:yes gene_type:complete
MKIGFKAFASILGGMNIIGISVGFLVGYYISSETQIFLLMYCSAPLLGLGSGLVIYGTLYGRDIES